MDPETPYRKVLEILNSGFPDWYKAIEILKLSLPAQQLLIFDEIPAGEHRAISAHFLSRRTGISTRNVSSQLKQMIDKGLPIKTAGDKRRFTYYIKFI